MCPPSFLRERKGTDLYLQPCGGGARDKVSCGTSMPLFFFFFKWPIPCHKQLWCHSEPPAHPTLSPPPLPSAGSLRQAEAQLNSSTFFTYPQTTTSYYYGCPPFRCLLPFPASREEPRSGPGRRLSAWDNGRPTPSRLWAFRILRSFSAPGANTAQSRRLANPHGSTHTVELSRSTFLHTAPSAPPPPPELRESLSGASDRRVPPTRVRAGREERREGPTAARLPAPKEAARVGHGAEPEFRKRRGWLSSMKSYS